MNNKKYIHGGDIYTEGILKGRNIIDFSSNINPLGVPETFKKNIEEAFKMVERYPDIQYRQLKTNIIRYIKKYWDVTLENENLILGNGASEIIDLSIKNLKKIVIPAPSFSEYSISCKKWGVAVAYSYLTKDMEYDYEDIKIKLENSDGVIFGNPNNPNGGILNKIKFKEILDICERKQKIIIVDEAFIEFAEEGTSIIDNLDRYKCLIIIRALTKYFAVPGIRFGYGITFNNEIISCMKENQNPWNINSFAELCVKYSLNDENYIDLSKRWIREEKQYMMNELRGISIINKVYITNCNYILCKLNFITSQKLYEYCLEKGILIRKANNFEGLSDEYVRFAIKNRSLNNILIEVLRNYDC